MLHFSHFLRKRVRLHRFFMLAGSAAVVWAFLLVARPGRSDSPPNTSSSKPFTLTIRQTRNNGRVWAVQTEARRSDGATATLVTVYLTPRPRKDRVVELSNGTVVQLADAEAAKSTCVLKHFRPTSTKRDLTDLPKPPDCLGASDKLLDRTTLFGQPVDVIRTWDRGSSGESWRDPALGCKEIQWQNASLLPDGSRKVTSAGKLVSYIPGAPNPKLFRLGKYYTEVKPSKLMRLEAKAAGQKWVPSLAKQAKQQDEMHAVACKVIHSSRR